MKLFIENLENRVQLSVSNFVPYNFQETALNTVQNINVLAVNFDPTIPSQNNKYFWEVFPGWSNPRDLATAYEKEMERVSGGAINFEIVEWRDINDIPVLENGYKYTADEFYRNAINNWTGFQPGNISADFYKIATSQNFVNSINSGFVDEVWLFGEHHFQLFGESWMAGPDSFFVNGPIFNCPELNRPFIGLSFDCGRGLPEMMHNMAHRAESTMERFYGGWDRKNPQTNWDRFAAVASQTTNGIGGIGNCHFPVNGQSDYDYSNTSVVRSTANDWANYPNMTFSTSMVSRDSWGVGTDPDYHKDYLSWWFGHFPRESSKFVDGRQNNWWKYLYDYNNYYSNGVEKPFLQNAYASNVSIHGGVKFTFTVSFSSAYNVIRNSIGTGDILVVGPNGYSQSAFLVSISDSRDNRYLVGTFSITAPGGFWNSADNGTYFIKIIDGSVRDVAGRFSNQVTIGSFRATVNPIRDYNPFVPRILNAKPIGTRFLLSWTTPFARDPRIPILGYKVSYTTNGVIWKTLPFVYRGNSAIVTGIFGSKEYYFRVAAVTRFGIGEWSLPSNRVVSKIGILPLAPK